MFRKSILLAILMTLFSIASLQADAWPTAILPSPWCACDHDRYECRRQVKYRCKCRLRPVRHCYHERPNFCGTCPRRIKPCHYQKCEPFYCKRPESYPWEIAGEHYDDSVVDGEIRD